MAGAFTGSWQSTCSRAWVPPVEVPSRTMRSVVRWLCSPDVGRSSSASALSLAVLSMLGGASGLTRALAAERIAATISRELSWRKSRKPSVGLQITSTAPAARAWSVISAPFSVSVEQITTGVGRVAMIRRRKVMPSMRGISTSSRITSGHIRSIFCRASSGSMAIPTTSISRCAASICCITSRITAESSTIITLMPMIAPQPASTFNAAPRRTQTSPLARSKRM
ncbi:hypothetical protein D9M69_399210 [compost metagenome]